MTWVLITLMCFSVLGLIYIQFYWINEAYHLKEQDFRKQVGEALDNISKRIQQEEVIKTMKSQASSRVWLNSQKGDAESNLQSGIEDYAWFRNQSTKLSDLEFGFSIEESNNGFFSIEDSIEPDPSLKLKYSFEISEPALGVPTTRVTIVAMEMITDIIPHMRCRNHVLNVNNLIELITDRSPFKVCLYCFVNVRCGQSLEGLNHLCRSRSLYRNRWFVSVDVITDCGEYGIETRMSLTLAQECM